MQYIQNSFIGISRIGIEKEHTEMLFTRPQPVAYSKYVFKYNNIWVEIGKYILSKLLIAVGPCVEKNKNNWIEITNDSLLLIKKIGNSIDIQCIPAGVLGILTTISILPEIQKYFPNINIPFLDIDLPAIQHACYI